MIIKCIYHPRISINEIEPDANTGKKIIRGKSGILSVIKIMLIPLMFFGSLQPLVAQEEEKRLSEQFDMPEAISEVIRYLGGDTVIFFYNARWQMVKPKCASIFRISRFDADLANFTGEFTDFYGYDSTIAVKGNYVNGKKEGPFKIYHPGGHLAQEGSFTNDERFGIWKYFYEDGSPKQVFEFLNGEVLIREFWDEKGEKQVDAGQGKWFGYDLDNFYKTSGKVSNGKKQGMWTNLVNTANLIAHKEKFNKGRMISGEAALSRLQGNSYRDKSLTTIHADHWFENAEKFNIGGCKSVRGSKWEYSIYPGGTERFYQQVYARLRVEKPLVPTHVQIQTTIDINGKMTAFKPITNTGYENALMDVLETLGNWTPTTADGKSQIFPKIIGIYLK